MYRQAFKPYHRHPSINLREALQSTLVVLTSPVQPTSSTGLTRPSTETLHQDLLSLLALLKSHTTSLALAIGKTPPTPYAALSSLNKLTTDWTKVCWLLDQVGNDDNGTGSRSAFGPSELEKEWKSAMDDVQLALQASIRGYQFRMFPSSSDRAAESEKENAAQLGGQADYLIDVRAVFSAIDTATRSLSASEIQSLVKTWKIHGDQLKDGELELREIIESIDADRLSGDEGSEDEDDDDDDDNDDDWGGLMGDLSLGKKSTETPMTSQERDRINLILPLLRFPSLLHTNILKTHLLPTLSADSLSSLPALSKSLLTAQDTLVSALYSPQTLPDIQSSIACLEKTCLDLSACVRADLQGLAKEEIDKKAGWLDVWDKQVKRISKELIGKDRKLIP
ncbi:hypothetical protein [Phaffia rhodozyma]|uniref:Uncharacterized protein n=1 Tax=Phaffia rhodozyma TaxID=264483 RepID=A0A0F7SEU9_PHARH|nr:hypothetical protein [Phaffia rhodozyma]